MNYYEELGLTESASVEEIRQAYKSLARLLHPDHQREEQLQKIAELQMMRLNEILAVLSDPLRREKYDASICPAAAAGSTVIDQEMPAWPDIHLGHFRISVGTIVWSASLVVAAVGFSFALLYFEHGSVMPLYEKSSPRTTPPSPAAAPVTWEHEAAPPPSNAPPAKRVIKAGKKDSSMLARVAPIAVAKEQKPQQSQETRTNPTSSPPAAVATSGASAPPPGPNVLNPADSSPGPLAGTWLYAKSSTDSDTGSSSVYRPEYIEMVVKPGVDGKISGHYLGRFTVPDQALSSEVRFTFEGLVGGGTTVLPWRNGDGAEGRVRMRIVSESAVEVTWYTTKFGSARKLASGTAVLRRD